MSLYINIWDSFDKSYPFQIFIGGRGTGKTYSALNGVVERNEPFIYMRRTAQELDMITNSKDRGEGANPFKVLNKDKGYDLAFHRIKQNFSGIYHTNNEGQPEGLPAGYGIALSTISSIRGLDFSDVKTIIYDEFIPESHVKKIKDESEALFNAYETINRNRELSGQDPVYMFLLANSNNIYNEIFKGMNVVKEIEKMIRRNKEVYSDQDRGLRIHLLSNNSDYVNAKSNTALYKLTAGTKFSDMALNNKFAFNDFSLVGYKDIKGLRPVASIGNAYIYEGKEFIYVTYAIGKCVHYNNTLEQDRKAFCLLLQNDLQDLFVRGRLFFESYELKQLVLDLIYNR